MKVSSENVCSVGIVTVDDLLNRIDETVENSKLVVKNGKENTAVNIQQTQKPPAAANPEQKPAEQKPAQNPATNSEKKPAEPTNAPKPAADAEKKPAEPANAQNPEATDEKREDDPIRLNYLEIKSIGDILLKINDQPGNRRVVLENAPNPNTAENKDAAASGPKSILKSSQDPSSTDTSTKVAALDDNEIHVDLAGVQKLDDLLDRIDETVAQVPVVIETDPREEKKEGQLDSTRWPCLLTSLLWPFAASQPANATQPTQAEPPKNQAPPASTNDQSQKSQAPAAPAGTNDQSKKTEAPPPAARNDQAQKSQAPAPPAPAATSDQAKKSQAPAAPASAGTNDQQKKDGGKSGKMSFSHRERCRCFSVRFESGRGEEVWWQRSDVSRSRTRIGSKWTSSISTGGGAWREENGRWDGMDLIFSK